MKYIINNSNLSDLQAKLQDFLSKNYQNKYYKKIKTKIFAYINLCKEFFLETKLLLKDLIKKYFKNKFSTFYYWANKILLVYANNNFEDLLLKSTVPNNINYQYSNDVRENICDLYFEYSDKRAGGVLSLYYNLKKGIHGEELKNKAPKNLKTFFRWLKKDKRWLKIKNKIKEIKRQNKNEPIIINSYQNEPITYNVNYSKYWSMWANWSTTESYTDENISYYAVVDYTNYAKTFDEFIKKYPFVTIETSVQAVSKSTFGDVGKGNFGTLYYNTKNFNNNKYSKKYECIVCASDLSLFAYSISVTIGLKFFKLDNKLYLNPFIAGILHSDGAYTRYLDFGLTVNTITFNPKINN